MPSGAEPLKLRPQPRLSQGQLGAEQNAHQLTKGALDEALAAAEASRTEAVVWRWTVEGEF